ncbi:TIGR01906 family membrane protein [Peptoniphilus sp. KCTC 25270]|nr:TIGR01906 family membrane protein [Peptoniphilus sp. KCTC 25270]
MFLFLGVNIEFQSQRDSYYKSKFIENNIEEATGKDLKELLVIGEALQDYLKVGDNNILNPYFHSDEVAHMVDVYKLFDLMRKIMWIAGGLSLLLSAFLIKVHGLRLFLKKYGQMIWIWIFLLGIFIGLVAMDFNRAFVLFHKLLFSNDLWMMDPSRDLMIQMLPENFFGDMGKNIAIGTGILLFLSAMLGFTKIKGVKRNEFE